VNDHEKEESEETKRSRMSKISNVFVAFCLCLFYTIVDTVYFLPLLLIVYTSFQFQINQSDP